MKKVLLLAFILLMTGCNSSNAKEIPSTTTTTTTTAVPIKQYVDDNPINIGLYMYYNSYTNRKLISGYTANWIEYQDICSLEVFFTKDDEIPGTIFQSMWPQYYNKYTNIDNYKVGFNIEFDTIDGHIKQNILTPNDTYIIFDYIQLYLYDDVHQQPGVWYSHITEEEYNDTSILSSIKLTGSTRINEITSDIILTVFTYDTDDFDSQGFYRGNSSYKVIIKRQS